MFRALEVPTTKAAAKHLHSLCWKFIAFFQNTSCWPTSLRRAVKPEEPVLRDSEQDLQTNFTKRVNPVYFAELCWVWSAFTLWKVCEHSTRVYCQRESRIGFSGRIWFHQWGSYIPKQNWVSTETNWTGPKGNIVKLVKARHIGAIMVFTIQGSPQWVRFSPIHTGELAEIFTPYPLPDTLYFIRAGNQIKYRQGRPLVAT